MDKELLEPLFEAIDKHTNRLNKLDTAAKDFNTNLTLVKTELLREIDSVVSKEIAKLPKPKEVKEPDYAVYQSLLKSDLDKFDTQVKKDISSLGSKLGADVKSSLEATVKAYVASIRDTLKGDIGKLGKDGQRGLQGLPGASVKGDKGDKGDPGKDAISPKLPDIKKLVKEEVAKIKLPKAEVFPVAPVPQSGLSMVAVKAEIDRSINNITAITEEDLSSGTLEADLTDLNISGKFTRTTANITTTSTININKHINFINASSDIIITVPTAVGNLGAVLNLKRIDSTNYTVTIICTSSETIDGEASNILNSYENMKIVSNGSNWFIL